MKISASSPTKIIIAGEHAVVHGCIAIAVPLDVRNSVTIETLPEKKVVVKESVTRGYAQELNEKMLQGLNAVYSFVNPSLGVVFDRRHGGMPTGTGNSASIASAFALCLYAIDGRTPSIDELFNATQEFEKAMHVNPSGIDARTVLSDSAIIMKKSWDSNGKAKFDFKSQKLVLPKGTALLIVDRSGLGEKQLSTGELVTTFSKTLVGKTPNEVTQAERDKIIAPFEPVILEIIKQLNENGNAHELGGLFLENNALLEEGGVITESMVKTVGECIEAGCLGAKGTGACGPGGAVIALAYEKDIPQITAFLEARKYKVIPAKFAIEGPKLE